MKDLTVPHDGSQWGTWELPRVTLMSGVLTEPAGSGRENCGWPVRGYKEGIIISNAISTWQVAYFVF